MWRPLGLAPAALGALMLLSCGRYSTTPRVVSGEPIEDRPISENAYAAYLDGAELEARGQLQRALVAYRAARSYDGRSAEIQTRIAALICKLEPAAATREFEEAVELDRSYEGAWRHWAECELSRGKATRALRMAKLAVENAPDSLAATRIVAQVHEARREATLALRQWIAYVSRWPNDLSGWRELYSCAKRLRDPIWQLRAGQVLREVRYLASNSALSGWARYTDTAESAREAVRVALLASDLKAARERATDGGLGALEVAWLALELHEPELARRQAEFLWRANPQDTDALVAAVLASHRLQDAKGYRHWLALLSAVPTRPLSRQAELSLEQLLEARALAPDASEANPSAEDPEGSRATDDALPAEPR